ncbi:MAG TPA: UvrB/UvrC motif-containing protein [Phycisphaerae bacterium]|nr:UvrB/UvrC motif-containing protein [Phycisphaerae bacterium]
MKCQKCSKPAVIHLTEIITDSAGAKRAVEIHLCLGHAAEAGLVAPGSEILPQGMAGMGTKKSEPIKPTSAADTGLPTAIVPAAPTSSGGLVVTREKGGSSDPSACPVCGTSWSHFKQSGLMGCSHDYELYEGKLLPLLKRAQEGSTQHVGKVPHARKTPDTDRQLATLRLRRELQKAIDAENYEQAAKYRDELRKLEN